MHPLRLQRVRRRGVLSMELVFTLPILGVLVAGLLEFSLVFFARADVVDACRAGARKATLHGATPQDVEAEVRRVLTPRLHAGLTVTAELNARTGEPVTVAVSTPMSAAAPDLLWPIGFSLEGRDLYCETRMAKE
jgi:Flp pilus assembly protein TadG